VDRLAAQKKTALLEQVLAGLEACGDDVSTDELAAIRRYAQRRESGAIRCKHDWGSWARVRSDTHHMRTERAVRTAEATTVDHACVFAVVWAEACGRALEDAGNRERAAEQFVVAARHAWELGWKRKSRTLIRRVFGRYFCETDPFWLELNQISEIRTGLQDSEYCVAYSVIREQVVALVVWRNGWNVVPLGTRAPVARLVDKLRSPLQGEQNAIRLLRSRLVLPLDIPDAAKAVVVFPQSRIGSVPWSLLFGSASVRCVPILLKWDNRVAYKASGKGFLGFDARDIVADLANPPATLDRLDDFTRRGASRKRWRAIYWNADYQERLRRFDTPHASEGVLRTAVFVHMPVRADVVVFTGVGASLLAPAKGAGGPILVNEPGDFKIPRVGDLAATVERIKARRLGPLHVVGELSPMAVLPAWDTARDATAAFVREFHSRLARGAKVREALRLARAEVAKQKAWKHPHYWACWELWGFREG